MPNEVASPQPPKSSTPIKVSTTSFKPGDTIPREFAFTGCGGKNVSPQLSWSDFPKETKSFAITIFDPDAPTGSGYWHWLVSDIAAKVTSLDAGAGSGKSPAGGKTSFSDYGLNTYGGPCPPKGDKPHRYYITVYALDVPSLGVDERTTGATFVFHMRGHLLAQGTIMGTFAT